ncbi:MAG: type II toxin-antitoxin system death-on-curing family toxin [Patescibacteria group bacterium]|nr:type II toxin-antitoxin system death-on-curing family toxin [Patescibacteria group bacterium]
MPRRIQIMTVAEVERITHRLAKELMEYDEPIPDFDTRYPGKLESCLAVPFQTFQKKSLYPRLLRRAAVLFYLMIKNHPFQNGNKRVAMTTVFVYLYQNNKWLRVDAKELYNFAVWVASSPPKLKDDVINAAEKFFASYIVSL